MSVMIRRDFITLIGGAAVWPLAARAQQPARVGRVGVLMNLAADDPEGLTRFAVFVQELQQLGWNEGRNMRIDHRWAGGSVELFRKYALELVALAPDVILASGFPSMAALRPVTHSVPVVFVLVADPVGAGFVESLARPGGNVTGFALYEFGMSAKWLELLKRIAPNVTRVGVLRDTALATGVAYLAAIQSVAPSLGIEVSSIGVREGSEIERAVTAFAGSSNRGLIMTPTPYTAPVRNLIIALAARHKLPTVYYQRYLVAAGGLASYAPDFLDEYRRAAGYVNRILKGAKPADLPVEQSTRFEFVINLKTASALGLTIPPGVLAIADEVIE
jgi:putative tryptophan/tyrosine transport system substrate-binding protein